MKILAASFLFLGATLYGADRTHLTVTAVSHDSALREWNTVFNNPTNSNTTCSGSGVNNGSFGSAQVNCNTQTTGGPQTVHSSRLDVRNIVEATGQRYTIECSANWRGSNCLPMEDGAAFAADYDGKQTMWVTAHKGGNLGPLVVIKYRVLDIRPVMRASSQERTIAAALNAARERHPDFDSYERDMSALMEKLPHGTMALDEYIESVYTLAKANATRSNNR